MLGIRYAEGFSIPPGHKFEPTGEEVLKYYLIPAIHHQELPCNILREFRIYGEDAEPWKVFGEEGNVDVWVLTQVNQKSKAMIERTAGCGTWNGQNKTPIKDSHKKVIGRIKYFDFEYKDEFKLKGKWTMHEYSLINSIYNYVICHIKKKQDSGERKTQDPEENFTRSILCDDKLRKRKKIMSGVVCADGFRIPPGYWFNPTGVEVLKYYLIPSIHRQELPCNILSKFNIYGHEGAEPWKMFGEKEIKNVWVLTQVMNKSQSMMKRRVGCGTWKGGNNRPIQKLGCKRYFAFECDDKSKLHGNWGMHEYSLLNYEHNYTICHIEKKEDFKEGRQEISLESEDEQPSGKRLKLCLPQMAPQQESYEQDHGECQGYEKADAQLPLHCALMIEDDLEFFAYANKFLAGVTVDDLIGEIEQTESESINQMAQLQCANADRY